ncbi:MAG TPA: cytidine deaminase [bacterium]|nr:cytidine deaminase [bacterium]
MDDAELIRVASEALGAAYAPYSKFRVGASALVEDGEAFSGCNVENASFGLTICAERAAIFAAVAHGYKKIEKIAIVGEKADRPPYPCGACLQVMSEFGVREVIVGTMGGPFKSYEFGQLLPRPFKL